MFCTTDHKMKVPLNRRMVAIELIAPLPSNFKHPICWYPRSDTLLDSRYLLISGPLKPKLGGHDRVPCCIVNHLRWGWCSIQWCWIFDIWSTLSFLLRLQSVFYHYYRHDVLPNGNKLFLQNYIFGSIVY